MLYSNNREVNNLRSICNIDISNMQQILLYVKQISVNKLKITTLNKREKHELDDKNPSLISRCTYRYKIFRDLCIRFWGKFIFLTTIFYLEINGNFTGMLFRIKAI